MLTLTQIRTQLELMRIDKVASLTGLSYGTIQKIRSGTQHNPSYRSLKTLSDFLQSHRD